MENQQFRGGPTHKCLPIPPSCSDRAENTRNRKIWFFCFRALSRFFFQLQEKIFFGSKKNCRSKMLEFFKIRNFQWKINNFSTKIVDFPLKISDFEKFQHFRATIFFRAKKYFFLELKKKSGQSSEAEKPYLSIARVFSSIRATRRDWQAFMCRTPSKLLIFHFFTIRSS